MKGKKKKSKPPWWRKARNMRRMAIGVVSLVLAVMAVGYLVMRGGGDEPRYNTRFASQFTLPTISGEEVTLSQHLGRHNVLLYFNEGMG